jgi:hypothetical protein
MGSIVGQDAVEQKTDSCSCRETIQHLDDHATFNLLSALNELCSACADEVLLSSFTHSTAGLVFCVLKT